jgi:hypothetical protein
VLADTVPAKAQRVHRGLHFTLCEGITCTAGACCEGVSEVLGGVRHGCFKLQQLVLYSQGVVRTVSFGQYGMLGCGQYKGQCDCWKEDCMYRGWAGLSAGSPTHAGHWTLLWLLRWYFQGGCTVPLRM